MFSVQFLFWLTVILWHQEHWSLGMVIPVGQQLSPLVIVSTIFTVAVVEGLDMLAEQFKRRRYEQGREKGRQEGRREAMSEFLKLLEESDGPVTLEDLRRAWEKLDSDDGRNGNT